MTNAPAIDQSPTLSATVVLHHSPLTQLQAMITSLDKAARLLGANLPLYLVDQSQSAAYSQAVQAMLRKAPSDSLLQLHYIARVTNNGYGAGHNTVLDAVLGHYHLILNPDVELPESALVQIMDNLKDHPEVAIMAPRAATKWVMRSIWPALPECLVLSLGFGLAH